MLTKFKNWAIILAFTLLPTFAIWLPFILRLEKFWTIPLPKDGMATIVANYDGPLYIVVAKTLYNVAQIKTTYSFPLSVEYYAAHFPLFPLLTRLFSFALGFPYAMLAVTITSSFAAIFFFHKLAEKWGGAKNALWLTFVFSIFPARFLIVRSVGSPDPLFVAAILASVYYFVNRKYWLAGVAGAIAQVTKSPGILLFAAYALSLAIQEIKKLGSMRLAKWLTTINFKTYPIVLIPLSAIGVFTLYYYKFGNFFAYFNSGDNIHLFFPPFQIFNYSTTWVGTFWLEEIIFVYLFFGLTFTYLLKHKETVFPSFVGIFLLSIIFVSHRDLLRYALPLAPFSILTFSSLIVKREFKIVMVFLIIPIYLFSLAYISQNVMPISNWQPLL